MKVDLKSSSSFTDKKLIKNHFKNYFNTLIFIYIILHQKQIHLSSEDTEAI